MNSSATGWIGADDVKSTFTVDYIARHAARSPANIAIIEPSREITYAELYRDLGRFIRAVRLFGLGPGDVVALEWTSLYLHWLLALAFESEGILTFTYAKEEAKSYGPFLATVDLVIGDEKALPTSARRVHSLTQNWIDSALAMAPLDKIQRPALGLEAPVITYYGSGTTSAGKRMIQNVRAHDFRIRMYGAKAGFTAQSRFLLSHGFSVQFVYGNAAACLRQGGTCISSANSLVDAVRTFNVTHMPLLPGTLAMALERLPPDFVKPEQLTVLAFGAPMPATLRVRALQVFASAVTDNYGSNEVGSVCRIDSDGIGTVLPGVQVEVVDDNDQILVDQPGYVRVKSDGVVAGYTDDPDTTARMFKNGWFYPGDIGVMRDSQTLKLIGRADDLINIGGVKIHPATLEDQLRPFIVAKDFCITALVDAEKYTQVWIALVLDPPTTLQDIVTMASKRIPPLMGKVGFINVAQIPRTPTGKAQRHKLNALILKSQKTNRPARSH